MNPAQIDEKLRKIVIDTLKIPESDYSEELAAGDHPQWDSIGHVNLLMAVEQGFEISFDVTDAIDIESVADLRGMVAKYVTQKNASAV
jgi:acyl carrier protein